MLRRVKRKGLSKKDYEKKKELAARFLEISTDLSNFEQKIEVSLYNVRLRKHQQLRDQQLLEMCNRHDERDVH
uniref:Uncharacterized protein n=1 Tax=Oryza nivara TaxID=4536 RepID=A0A0E0HJE0_ORYNI